MDRDALKILRTALTLPARERAALARALKLSVA